jgi:hypothetical protein
MEYLQRNAQLSMQRGAQAVHDGSEDLTGIFGVNLRTCVGALKRWFYFILKLIESVAYSCA